jgi:hypothetical protein
MAQKIVLNRGNTLVLNYTNQDNSTPPLPISLSGATLYFTVKANPGWDTVANDSTALWQITSTGNSGNTATFTSTPVNTWVTPGVYDWDITINYGSGNVITVVTGTIQIVGVPTNKAS